MDYKIKKSFKNIKKEKQNFDTGGASDDDEPPSFVGLRCSTFFPDVADLDYIASPAIFESALMSSTNSDRWVVDTGADRHICRNLELFETYQPSDSLASIGTASGFIRPLGTGSVTLRCKLKSGKYRKIPLTNVLHIPRCPFNLFSGRKLYAQGGYMGSQGSIFDSNHLEIATFDENLRLNEYPRSYNFPAALYIKVI